MVSPLTLPTSVLPAMRDAARPSSLAAAATVAAAGPTTHGLTEAERRDWIAAQFRMDLMRKIFFPDEDAPDALPRLRPDGDF